MELPKQFDNVNSRVIDDLRTAIKRGSRISMAAASFSIYAFEALKNELQNIDELQFIFTSPTFNKEKLAKEKREFYIPKLNRERNLYGSEFEIMLRNKLSQKAIARECGEWIRKKVKFKTNISPMNMQGFFIVENSEETLAYTPINDFTTTELGCEHGNDMYKFIMRMSSPMSSSFVNTFKELWSDKEKFTEVTDSVLENIENVYRENSPEFVYFLTLYNIFNEFLEDISEDVLPNEATGFKQSLVWNKLYNFQKDAALAIINKLEKYNGCILADSVGLGKTFTALSVIKYYENRNKSVLVLCPKKLNDNWSTYRQNYINNPIAGDRLRYDILFHSDLSRDRGESNGLNLEHINWGNYDLIVIDESHNFRNGGDVTYTSETENRENRYLRLMNRVIRQGVKTKVLMLSATPVNNKFLDLKNQLSLAYEGDAKNINDLLETKSHNIDRIFSEAQKAYNRWTKLPQEERSTQRLQQMLDFDFFELLDAVTIARSRKHIQQYYDTADIGTFPTRLQPISKRPKLTDLEANKTVNYKDIAGLLNELNLSIYAPSAFILDSARDKYMIDGDESSRHLGMTGREKGIRKLMAINMLKRLESSVNSFRLTLHRVKEQIDKTISTINEFEKNHQGGVIEAIDYSNGFDGDDSENDVFVGGKRTKVNLADMDYVSWRKELTDDQNVLDLLIFMIADITPEHDSKLQELISNLREKFHNPINPGNKKVIIFTAFSDTAEYLYDELADRILQKEGLYTGLVTGDVVSSNVPKQRADFNTILTLFSPCSKDADKLIPNRHHDIDVLIATDCISEGQNLQDCDYLIDYDIHWNPVRIIQRFGRVDRIGSKNSVIQLVNYWPDIELDDYIKLKGRVESRMKATILTATGDDNLLTKEEEGDLQYRKKQLERLQKEVVDLEEMDTGINIMDLGLNEFRLDLLSYMKEGHDVEHAPFGLHAVLDGAGIAKPGVVFIMKNRTGAVNIDHKNRLHPFYMVYLDYDGECIINHLEPKALLDCLRKLCKGKSKPMTELCRQFNSETRNGLSMSPYSDLLSDAIRSIINVKEESDIESFLKGVQGDLFSDAPKGLDDFELICFFVIK